MRGYFLTVGTVTLLIITELFSSGVDSYPSHEVSKDKNNMDDMRGERMSEKEALIKTVNNYVEILSEIGNPQSDCQSENITPLCSQNCKKVRNGKVLFEGKDFFAAQLGIGKKWLGAWSIDVQEVLISADNRAAVIRYELATEKVDTLVVIAILHFDSNYLIDEINEVHNTREK